MGYTAIERVRAVQKVQERDRIREKQNFIQRRKEAFERFKAKRKEAVSVRAGRRAIKRQNIQGRTLQDIGKEKSKIKGRLQIAKEKGETRKLASELKRLRQENFKASFLGKVGTGAVKLGKAGYKTARTQRKTRRITVRRIPKLQRNYPSGKRIPQNIRRKFKRQFKVTRARKRARRRPERSGLYIE